MSKKLVSKSSAKMITTHSYWFMPIVFSTFFLELLTAHVLRKKIKII
jgi:hypothetical protein